MLYGTKTISNSKINEYRSYIINHVDNVKLAFVDNIDIFSQIFDQEDIRKAELNIQEHDQSKLSIDEFQGYLNKFYPEDGHEFTDKDQKAYDMAWIHHYTNNLHHPEAWVMIEAEPKKVPKLKLLEMDDCYIIEMICDWESFKYSGKGSAFDFYYGRDNKMGLLHENTRKKVEKVLKTMHHKN